MVYRFGFPVVFTGWVSYGVSYGNHLWCFILAIPMGIPGWGFWVPIMFPVGEP